jgi:hypothetical protein
MAYVPEPFLGGNLTEYVQRELRRVSEAWLSPEVAYLLVEVRARPPERPREGLVVAADGVNWNPGAGAGIYAYYSGAWNKLG